MILADARTRAFAEGEAAAFRAIVDLLYGAPQPRYESLRSVVPLLR